jgi:hypothetical protein
MNCDRSIARQRWKRRRPAIYAAIGDPGTYFTKLSEQAGNTCWISLPASTPAFPDPRRPDRIAAGSWRRPRNVVEAVFNLSSRLRRCDVIRGVVGEFGVDAGGLSHPG